jgi:hypothetical protein
MLTYGLDNILAVLTLILVSGTVLTVPTAMLLLRLFRRSVQKGMTAPRAHVAGHPIGGSCAQRRRLT